VGAGVDKVSVKIGGRKEGEETREVKGGGDKGG